MSTPSMQKLEKYLREYSVDLEYWSADMGDSHEMLGARELIEDGKLLLNQEQQVHLNELDTKAKALLDAYQGPETWDVIMLRQTVAIAYPEYCQAA